MRLARIGYENVDGYLDGGIQSWLSAGMEVDSIESITAEELASSFSFNSASLVDVRNPDEWIPGFVAGSKLIPLSSIESEHEQLETSKTSYIYCAGGYRSMVAASILKKLGHNNVVNVLKGMSSIKNTDLPLKQLTTTH